MRASCIYYLVASLMPPTLFKELGPDQCQPWPGAVVLGPARAQDKKAPKSKDLGKVEKLLQSPQVPLLKE